MKTVLSWLVAVGAVVAGVCAGANVSAPGGDPSVREDLDTLTETVSAQGASLLSEIGRVDDGLVSLAFHFTERAAAGALELVDGYMSTFGDSADDVSSVEGGVWSSGGWSASARKAFAHAKRFWVQLPYASVPAYGAGDTFSVSVWIRPTATDIAQVDGQFSVVRHQTQDAGFRLGIIGGKPYFNVDGRIYGGDWYATASSGTPVASNTWTLLVGTWTCAEDIENPGTYENVTALYVNGALVSSVTNVDAGKVWGYPVQESAEPYLTVGGSAYVYHETVYNSAAVILDGRTAQAAIWDALLDDDAVAALYNAGAGVDLSVDWPPWYSLAVLVDGNGATTAEVGGVPTETVVLNGSAKPATALYGGFVPSEAMTLTSDAYSLLSAPERLRVGAWLLGDGADLGDVTFKVSADGGSHYADVAMTRTSSLLDGSHYFASGVTTNFVAGTSLIMQMQSGGSDVTLRGWSRQAD